MSSMKMKKQQKKLQKFKRKRENAIKLTEQIDEDAKCAYMFSVYQAGKITFDEFKTFVQSKGEDLDRYREYALWFKLNNKYIV